MVKIADKRNIIIAILLAVLALSAWYGSRTVSDQQRTIDAARTDLRSASAQITELETLNASLQQRLDRGIQLADSIAARNTELENRIAAIQERNSADSATIDECIGLVERLREQTKSIRATGEGGENQSAD